MRYRMLLLVTVAQICAAVVQQGYGSLGPFIVGFFHLSKAQLGGSLSALLLGSALTVALGGVVVDRIGERKAMILTGLALGGTLLLAAAIPSYSWLVCCLFLLGIAYSPCPPAGGRAILTWFDKDRGFAMSIRQSGVPAGAAIGGILLPTVAFHTDYRWSLVAGAVIAIVGTAGLGAFYQDSAEKALLSRKPESVREGFRVFLRDIRATTCTITCSVLTGAQAVGNGFIAVSMVTLAQGSIALAALTFTLGQVCAVAGRIAWGRASDTVFRGDRILPIVVVCGVTAVASVIIGLFAEGRPVVMFCGALLFMFGAAGWNGVFLTLLAETGGLKYAGSSLGLGVTLCFLGGASGAVLFGILADAHGLGFAWFAAALVFLAAAIPPLVGGRIAGRRAAAAAA